MLITTDAIVVRRAEYRDYDRMITLFSPTHGRIDALARGCRRPKSALMNVADLFCQGEYVLNVVDGRYSVVQCQLKQNFYELRLDVDKLTHASYCLSLADAAALPGQPAHDVFVLLLKALAFIAYSELPPALVTLSFEARYMALMGYLPQMNACVICGAKVDGDGRFDFERGGVVCPKCPSHAPQMTAGARRIILRAPQTRIDVIDKLMGHPDWPLAARLYRPFVADRIERRQKVNPPLPDDEA